MFEQLVAGSGNTQSGDAQNAPLEEGKDDAAYGVGVPGPLTRLFVVANKGVAALIQDLILVITIFRFILTKSIAQLLSNQSRRILILFQSASVMVKFPVWELFIKSFYTCYFF